MRGYAKKDSDPLSGTQMRRGRMTGTSARLGLALVVPFAAAVICWPGPHGGLQFVGEGLWHMVVHAREQPFVALAVMVPLVGPVCGSVLRQRRARLGVTVISVAWIVVLLALLLRRIHPPVLPMVLLSTIPLAIVLILSLWLAARPDSDRRRGFGVHQVKPE